MKRALLAAVLASALALSLPPVRLYSDPTPEQTKEAQALIAQFSAKEFAARQAAVEKLIALGPDVLPLVKKTLAETADNEVKLRCEMTLTGISAAQKLGEERQRVGLKLVERRIKDLGQQPPDQCRQIEASAYGDGVVCLVMQNRREFVLHNGQKGPEYERIEGIRISPDGSRVAYVAQLPGYPSSYSMVCDGIESRAFSQVGEFVFSPDSKRMACAVKRGGNWYVLCEGEVSRPYEGYIDMLRFTPDSKSLIGVVRAQRKPFVCAVSSDGILGPSHDNIFDGPGLVRGGAKPRYWVIDKDQVSLVELDWPPSGPSPQVERLAKELIAQLSDGASHVREHATKSLGELGPDVLPLLRDARARTNDPEVRTRCDAAAGNMKLTEKTVRRLPKPPPGFPNAVDPCISPGGENLAYRVRTDGKVRLVFNGLEHKSYEKFISSPVFSPDGEHLAYVAENAGKQFLVLDGSEGPPYDEISPWNNPVFSPDSKHLAYVAKRDGKKFLVADGKELYVGTSVSTPCFSPDSRHLCYLGTRGQNWVIICDGLEGPEYELILLPRFSPDSRHLYYWAKRDNSWLIVCDSIKGPARSTPWFQDWQMVEKCRQDGGLRYIVVDQGQVWLVEVDWPEDLDWTNGLKPVEP